MTANVPSEKLEKCLYTINIGSNDYLNNYFMQGDKYNTSRTFTYDQYAEFLIGRYRSYLKVIYFIMPRFKKKNNKRIIDPQI